jgi:hypothetical protein
LAPTTHCGFMTSRAQYSVVIHRSIPVNSHVLGPAIVHFSPSYTQCLPPHLT